MKEGYDMKKLYLLHQYGAKTHFKALYDCADQYGYEVTEQIILSWYSVFSATYKCLRRLEIKQALMFLLKSIHERITLLFLKDQLMVVGLAPYDKRLNKFSKIFKRNKAFYFTSHSQWDGTECAVGSVKNKENFEKYLKECFLGAFCVSRAAANGVKKFIPNIEIVSHAVDYDNYKKRIDSNNEIRKFAFVGIYSERKNIRLILDWMNDNLDVSMEMHFFGEGELSETIHNAMKRDARIFEHGFQTKASLQEILWEFDFLILPSEKEPYGIVLLESLASGTPCIVSNSVGPSEIITNYSDGFIFQLENKKQSFDNIMKRALSISNEDLKKMRENSVITGEHYASRNLIKNWVRLLKQY